MRASGAVAKFKREFDKPRQKLLIEMGTAARRLSIVGSERTPRDEPMSLGFAPASRRRPSLLKGADAVGSRLSRSALSSGGAK